MSEDKDPENEEFNSEDNIPEVPGEDGEKEMTSVIHVSGMYRNWFLDYASYVILERAVPAAGDGLKPVQRRILHSMWELEDGRYNKVANVIGNTMKYHPHGDASIGDAMVQMGQKDLLIDTQGNWGNILTGDNSAAPRYIEARLSKFALEVVFNPKITDWQLSYDGRNKEPINLPVKFPLLLAHGVEGIAVGLSCKVLPHNFIEIIDGSIDSLKGRKTTLLPDFPTGGMMDASNYNRGLRGGKVRVRAKISMIDKKTLLISELPFGVTTTSLIDSILQANDKGKIKIRKIEDNTSEFVEIVVHLQAGVSPDLTIDALYAFTSCEVSISPNLVVIENNKPMFYSVDDLLAKSAQQTMGMLKTELNIKMNELLEQWHFSSLEKIFIEKKIYRRIEEAETWEEVMSTIHEGLAPFHEYFNRDITDEDVAKLTEIRIKRISKFDSFKADELIKSVEKQIGEVQTNLDNIIDFTVDFYKNLKKKFGPGKERKTEIKPFENIVASQVAAANVKLYVNREEGFAGYALKKDEFVCDCSDLDDIIVFRADGSMMVTKISDKAFVGKDIIHINVFRKNDNRTIYNMIYQDGPRGAAMMKRFAVTSITRDKEYDLTKGTKGSSVLYFTANPNGEAELVSIHLKPKPKLKKLQIDLNFADLAIKGRGANGNVLTKNLVKKIVQKEQGVSTLGALRVWFDDVVKRLNTEERGKFLGKFQGHDQLISIYSSGEYQIRPFDLTMKFDDDLVKVEKFHPEKVISAIYYDTQKKAHLIKRFVPETMEKRVKFIPEENGVELVKVSTDKHPQFEVVFREKEKANLFVLASEFEQVKGQKAKGRILTKDKVKDIILLEPLREDAAYDDTDEPDEQILDLPELPSSKATKSPDSGGASLTEQEKKDQVQLGLDFE